MYNIKYSIIVCFIWCIYLLLEKQGNIKKPDDQLQRRNYKGYFTV